MHSHTVSYELAARYSSYVVSFLIISWIIFLDVNIYHRTTIKLPQFIDISGAYHICFWWVWWKANIWIRHSTHKLSVLDSSKTQNCFILRQFIAYWCYVTRRISQFFKRCNARIWKKMRIVLRNVLFLRKNWMESFVMQLSFICKRKPLTSHLHLFFSYSTVFKHQLEVKQTLALCNKILGNSIFERNFWLLTWKIQISFASKCLNVEYVYIS